SQASRASASGSSNAGPLTTRSRSPAASAKTPFERETLRTTTSPSTTWAGEIAPACKRRRTTSPAVRGLARAAARPFASLRRLAVPVLRRGVVALLSQLARLLGQAVPGLPLGLVAVRLPAGLVAVPLLAEAAGPRRAAGDRGAEPAGKRAASDRARRQSSADDRLRRQRAADEHAGTADDLARAAQQDARAADDGRRRAADEPARAGHEDAAPARDRRRRRQLEAQPVERRLDAHDAGAAVLVEPDRADVLRRRLERPLDAVLRRGGHRLLEQGHAPGQDRRRGRRAAVAREVAREVGDAAEVRLVRVERPRALARVADELLVLVDRPHRHHA